jgi:hypothetical protein
MPPARYCSSTPLRSRPRSSTRASSPALYPRHTDLERDVGRARDVGEAQAGALLLFLGFVGQCLGVVASPTSSLEAVVAYGIAAVTVAALSSRPRLARRFGRELYLARIETEYRRWDGEERAGAQDDYRRYLDQ